MGGVGVHTCGYCLGLRLSRISNHSDERASGTGHLKSAGIAVTSTYSTALPCGSEFCSRQTGTFLSGLCCLPGIPAPQSSQDVRFRYRPGACQHAIPSVAFQKAKMKLELGEALQIRALDSDCTRVEIEHPVRNMPPGCQALIGRVGPTHWRVLFDDGQHGLQEWCGQYPTAEDALHALESEIGGPVVSRTPAASP